MKTDIRIPDIGDCADVPVVEISVRVGDRVAVDDPILMLESDKATLDIPSPVSGIVREICVAIGDSVREGALVMRIEAEAASQMSKGTADEKPGPASSTDGPAPSGADHVSLVVIGAGPGGYTAAFRAADLGRDVTLIDPRAKLGGVCLNVGCIPSKALLHVAKVRDDAAEAAESGLVYAPPKIDLTKIHAYRDGIVDRLTSGLSSLARKRKVHVIHGSARFSSATSLDIDGPDGASSLVFDQAIIATGSDPVKLSFLPDDPRIVDSTGALELDGVPDRLLVIGGGIIGLEMAQVYLSLGSVVEIAELADQIIPGADPDMIAPLAARLTEKGVTVRTGTKVTGVEPGKDLIASFTRGEETSTGNFDRILVAVGRHPSADVISPSNAGVALSPEGFIQTDRQMRTTAPQIFAIGDVVGQPMLAHKAVHEGKVAAEVASGENVAFEPACIPSVAYTDPEVAWVGLTETAARAEGFAVKVSRFPWMASGRSLSIGRDEGVTKLIWDPDTGKVLGGAITGTNAGDLIAEVALAIELGADAHDLGLTIHPHPTFSETIGLAAEAFTGTLTDL